MKIVRVKKTHMYDVFTGDGWKNHTRVLSKNNHIIYKSGTRLSKIQYVEISKTINNVSFIVDDAPEVERPPERPANNWPAPVTVMHIE